MRRITGMYPERFSDLFGSFAYSEPGSDRNKTAEIGSPEWTSIRSRVLDKMWADMNYPTTGPWNAQFFYPYECKVEGEIPNIPNRYLTLEKESTNNGKRWRARKRTRDIIVSPYFAGQAVFSYAAGRSVTYIGPPTTRYHNTGNMPDLWNSRCKSQWPYDWFTSPLGCTSPTNFAQPYRLAIVDEGFTPYDFGWSDIAGDNWFKDLRNQFTFDDSIIIECLAEANKGTIDFATAVAEAPMTLKSAYDGLKVLLRIGSEIKMKQFRLYNRAKKGSSTGAKNIEELNDALAKVWMTYRYEIETTVMMIEDAIVAFERYAQSEFTRTRKRVQTIDADPRPLGSFRAAGSITIDNRVCIKRLHDLRLKINAFKQVASMNIAVTTWELIPGSFIVDWAWNFGDMLAALSKPSGDVILQEGSTYSWKLACNVTFYHPDSGTSVNCEGSMYEVKVIDPSKHICVQTKPDPFGNWKRIVDSFAIGWALTKKQYKNRW